MDVGLDNVSSINIDDDLDLNVCDKGLPYSMKNLIQATPVSSTPIPAMLSTPKVTFTPYKNGTFYL